MKFLSKTTVP